MKIWRRKVQQIIVLWVKPTQTKFNCCTFSSALISTSRRSISGDTCVDGSGEQHNVGTILWPFHELMRACHTVISPIYHRGDSCNMMSKDCEEQMETHLNDHGFERKEIISSPRSSKYGLRWKSPYKVLQNQIYSLPSSEFYLKPFLVYIFSPR